MPGEECDCGIDNKQCHERDEVDSCYPKDTKNKKGCKLNKLRDPNIECSFRSSGPCCNSNNRFVPFNERHECEIESECTISSYCNGSSAVCPEPKPKPDLITPCNEYTQVCYHGECMRSICEHPDIGLGECSIKIESPNKSQRKEQCQIACKTKNETCVPLKGLKEQSVVNSSILNNLTSFQMTPGARCNGGKGFCDVLNRCRDVDPEGTLNRFTKLLFNQETAMTIQKFLKEKWYIVLVSGIAFIAIMAAFIQCFSLHTPSSNPRLPEAYAIGGTLRRPQRTLRRMVSFRDEPPPAYDEIFTTPASNNASGIEMSNVINRQSRIDVMSRSSRQPGMEITNRTSRQPGVDVNNRSSRQAISEVAYRPSGQPGISANSRASRQPGNDLGNRSSRHPGSGMNNRTSRVPP